MLFVLIDAVLESDSFFAMPLVCAVALSAGDNCFGLPSDGATSIYLAIGVAAATATRGAAAATGAATGPAASFCLCV
jgi:hypothetical protein